LLKLAAERAKQNKLPAGTAPNVAQFLSAEGVLTGDDWLWFDESAFESSLQAWAGASKSDPELAGFSRSFLLRQKVFLFCEIPDLTIQRALHLSVGLNAAGREGIDWMLDDAKFTSYKDFDSGFRGNTKKPDNAAVSTSAILISDGGLGSIAKPAELSSVVLSALGDNPPGSKTSLARIYYHESIAEKVQKVLESVGLKRG
jgi:hypothetical protein